MWLEVAAVRGRAFINFGSLVSQSIWLSKSCWYSFTFFFLATAVDGLVLAA